MRFGSAKGGGGVAVLAGPGARERLLRAVRGTRRRGRGRRQGRGDGNERRAGAGGCGGLRRAWGSGDHPAAGDRRRGGPGHAEVSGVRSRTSGRGRRTGGRWGSFRCGARREGSGCATVSPLHVAAYIRTPGIDRARHATPVAVDHNLRTAPSGLALLTNSAEEDDR